MRDLLVVKHSFLSHGTDTDTPTDRNTHEPGMFLVFNTQTHARTHPRTHAHARTHALRRKHAPRKSGLMLYS